MVEKFDYIESLDDADELIEEFGQVGAIPRSTSTPGPNPWDPPSEVTVFHAVKVAPLPINLQDAGKDIGGTVIKSSDQQVLMSPKGLAIVPTTTDILLLDGSFVGDEYVGGVAWTLISAKPLTPAGIVVLYDGLATR